MTGYEVSCNALSQRRSASCTNSTSIFDRITVDQAAARLGISRDAFHQRVSRGKAVLRRLLELQGWRR